MGAFKAYDIRGVWGEDLTPELVYNVGFFLPKLLEAKTVLVGRDVRLSSDTVYENLTKGITDAGADVWTIGHATTPMVYYSTVHFGVDASVQITASHNPPEYNGLKVSRKNAIPVGGDTGLEELEHMVETEKVVPAAKKGKIVEKDARTPYVAFMMRYKTDFSNLKLAIDCSNGMVNLIAKEILGEDHVYLNDTMDGHFPGHQPNPLDPKNCVQLEDAVVKNRCDVGIIYDGDADRVNFVDEKGRYVYADIMMAVLGIEMLKNEKGKIVADIRSSRSAVEYLEKLGGEVYMWKVGHVNAKAKIREIGAIYGGELAGHYYFRDFFNCDSAMFATLHILPVLSEWKKKGHTFSELLDTIIKWKTTGEINFKLEHKDEVMAALYKEYAPQTKKILDFDGYRFDFPTWWFNIRKSNTEPYLRLVLEAKTQKELDEKLAEVKKFIHD